LNTRKNAMEMMWRAISHPRLYRWARKFDEKSLFSFRFSGPDMIIIEPTNRCNIRCIMCGRTYFKTPQGDMDIKLYSKILDQIRIPLGIFHFGLGEPLLHPDIVEMIRIARRKGMHPSIITNGTILTPEMSRDLIRAGITSIGISLDAPTKKGFEYVRPGAHFETVVRNIADLVRIRAELEGEKPLIWVLAVPMMTNIRGFPELARMVKELGVDYFEVQRFELACQPGETDKIPGGLVEEDPFSEENRDVTIEVFKELDEFSIRENFEIKKPPPLGNLLYRSPFRCMMPYTYPVITWQGYLMPCFRFWDPREINMGSLCEKPFFTLWNGEPYRRFREALLSESPHPQCKSCRMFYGISQLWDEYAPVL